MTILHPHKSLAVINYILGALVLAVFTSALSLVYVYNQFVDTAHTVAIMKSDIERVQTEGAQVREHIFTLTGDSKSASIAAASAHLVNEKSPRYITLDSPWSLASR